MSNTTMQNSNIKKNNNESSSSLHSGHRERMRNKYLLNGKDVFETHEMLEMLLYYAVQRKDTCELAHRLLNGFGSLSAVLDAPIDLLIKFGLTEPQATLLKLIPDFAELYINDKHNNSQKIIDPYNIGDYITRKFISRETEQVLLVLTDAKFKELFCGFISKGTVTESEISVRTIVDLAMRYNARAAFLAHNHSSGLSMPSEQDVIATRNIKYALDLIGVKLIDHYIVSDNDCLSMRFSRIARDIFRGE